jgi:hypothetical protein
MRELEPGVGRVRMQVARGYRNVRGLLSDTRESTVILSGSAERSAVHNPAHGIIESP